LYGTAPSGAAYCPQENSFGTEPHPSALLGIQFGFPMEAALNVEALQQLKRVLAQVPDHRYRMGDWKNCACGHATQDAWFQARGFRSCTSMAAAMEFFSLTPDQAHDLFAVPARVKVTPGLTITMVDQLLEKGEVTPPARPDPAARRQAVIDGLLARADLAARKARETTSVLVGMFF
jgi:hypothetical protein